MPRQHLNSTSLPIHVQGNIPTSNFNILHRCQQQQREVVILTAALELVDVSYSPFKSESDVFMRIASTLHSTVSEASFIRRTGTR